MTKLEEIERWIKSDESDPPEGIIPGLGTACQPFTLEAAQEACGIYLKVQLDGFMYEEGEAMEVAEMVLRVVSAWWRRREVMHSNPEMFGVLVH
jgi:hypothetical protein